MYDKKAIGTLFFLIAAASAGVWLLRRGRVEKDPIRYNEEKVPTLLKVVVNTNTATNTNTMETDKTLPRGYRNNNPLNVRYNAANKWLGKYTPNTDGAFEQFKTMAYGYRCALYLLRKYITRYGCNTVRKIIQKWAPPTENNTQAYIQHVCEIAGLNADKAVNAADEDTLTRMAYAMSIIENGQNDRTKAACLPDMSAIKEGWKLL